MGKVAGIDLGTTFSAIAVVNKHGKAEIIANREGERITPSVVLFDNETPLVGSMAKRSAVASPDNVVQFVKRQMGNPSWKFPTESGQVFSAEDISAIIIKRLKEDAELILGEAIDDAVITVPAYFDDAQRKATQDAGRIAGFNVLRIINEPTAAALAYGIDKTEQKQTILVFDLGGGTFDVTIMRLGEGGIDVVATGGNRNLGGFDWDNAIMNFLNEQFKQQGGSDLFDNPTLQQDLRDKAEIAKKTLSSRDKTSVFLSAGGKTVSITITLAEFEQITESLLKKTASIMEFVLEDGGLQWTEIDKILLVGGSTRMKAVPALIEKVTGKKPSMEVNPDEVVAMGAALQGILLQIKEGKADLVERESFPLVEINDVCSHSMGVVSHDEMGLPHNSIVLNKNTAYGTKVSDVFATLSDRQTALDVQVTEGEDTDIRHVKIVGGAEVSIPPYPKGAPVEIFFEWNLDGMLNVTVFDRTSNRQLKEIKIKREGLNERQVEEKKKQMSRITVN